MEVLVVEEFGYAHWRWKPGMEPRELKAWFRGIDPDDGEKGNRLLTMDLPGTLEHVPEEELEAFHAAYGSNERWTAHIHWNDDSWLRAPHTLELVRPLIDPEEQDRLWDEAYQRLEATWIEAERATTVEGLAQILDDAHAAGVRAPRGASDLAVDLQWRHLGPGVGEVLATSPLARAIGTLDLTGNDLLDADLEAIVGLPIREITVGDETLTDAGIAALIGMPSLVWLDLGGRELGEASIFALQKRGRRLALVAERPRVGPNIAWSHR